ncbi:hypothetical protein LZD49_35185 [Dyadobacter sp. CY261]|uniref:hypothetical protein n=1 Tax=Dyadobacter sp. CY261 TaxID=2907203 RepID=UPI001F32EE27|nr:hypothetical protein [Dyadobacter sp. CY261]MCF0075768.1 hypothetical protein [Dyadobacter sp. CY261]
MEILLNVVTIAVCLFILILTIVSHRTLNNRRTDTIGRKLYRYLVVLFCAAGIWYGPQAATFIFLFAALLTERLIVYKGCRSKKDWLGRWLYKIGW